MEKRRDTHGHTPSYKPSGVNFFGRRAKPSDTVPGREPYSAGARVASTDPDAAAGKPYYPSNGHHRHLNFLGRSSLERNDKLLTNR